LKVIEREGNPICVVYWPEPNAALWGGQFGNARIIKGEPGALLSSGERVPL